MIFDSVANIRSYAVMFPNFEIISSWMASTDFSKLETGKKYPIDGDRVYAKIDEYNTFHSYEKNFEGHSRYADIQLMLSGDEIIEVKLKRGDEKEEVPYDEKKDMYKVKTYDSARILLRENEFAVFFPQDLHKPCISTSYRSEKVRKLVIKVLIDDKRK